MYRWHLPQLFTRAGHRVSGVVHDDVDASPVVDSLLRGLVYGVEGPGHIQLEDEDTAFVDIGLREERVEAFGVARCRDHTIASRQDSLDKFKAEASGST